MRYMARRRCAWHRLGRAVHGTSPKLSSGIAGIVMAAALAGGAGPGHAQSGEVNIYSYRQPELIAPLLSAFTRQTGIETNIIFAPKGLEERIAAEGRNSPADVIMTVDIGRLQQARQLNILQPVRSAVLESNIPAIFRDPDGHWFGLTTRARIIYASRERVPQDAITYEELADEKWRGRICTRSGLHVYSIGLIASVVAHAGRDAAREWLEGVRDNLARAPAGNDRAQIRSIYNGECDIAIGNTYYMGKMLTNEKEPEQKDWAGSVRILFPNQDGRGTHVNISGMAMARHAPNRENALRFMEFLSTGPAQNIYAEENFEYPVMDDVPVSDMVAGWGDFTADKLALSDIAAQRGVASELVEEVGFDLGPSS